MSAESEATGYAGIVQAAAILSASKRTDPALKKKADEFLGAEIDRWHEGDPESTDDDGTQK